MAPNLNVQYSAMKQAADRGFMDCANNAKSLMNTLEGELQSLLNSSLYQGDQATAFRNLHDQIQQEMDNVTKAFNALGDALNSANTKYQQGDQQAAQHMSQVASALPQTGSAYNTLMGA